jgi:hypothetical protein
MVRQTPEWRSTLEAKRKRWDDAETPWTSARQMLRTDMQGEYRRRTRDDAVAFLDFWVLRQASARLGQGLYEYPTGEAVTVLSIPGRGGLCPNLERIKTGGTPVAIQRCQYKRSAAVSVPSVCTRTPLVRISEIETMSTKNFVAREFETS